MNARQDNVYSDDINNTLYQVIAVFRPKGIINIETVKIDNKATHTN